MLGDAGSVDTVRSEDILRERAGRSVRIREKKDPVKTREVTNVGTREVKDHVLSHCKGKRLAYALS